MATTSRRRKRLPRANRSARRTRALVMSVLLLVAGIAFAGFGVSSWLTPRQTPVMLTKLRGVALSATPLFDPGLTVFATPSTTGHAPTPDQLGCALATGQREVPQSAVPDVETVGTRVAGGVSLLPVLDLGSVRPGAHLVCRGKHLDHGAVWVLPTLPSASPAAMSVVIAGVGLIGLALLVNPRARGYAAR